MLFGRLLFVLLHSLLSCYTVNKQVFNTLFPLSYFVTNILSSRLAKYSASDISINKEKTMAMKIYVGGLAYSVTEKELNELFAQYGKVESAVVIKDRDTSQSKGFGFVEMAELKEAQNAIKELNGKEVSGRSIVVNQARPQEDRRPAGGQFRR